jgi:chromosome partitioning protein
MKVRLADLDPRQASVVAWERTRQRNASLPSCEVVAYPTIEEALAASGDVELLILDTPGGTSRTTAEIARRSHLVVQPTGASADDLQPTVLTFHELVQAGVPRERLVAAICRTLSAGEERIVSAYVQDAGYEVLPGAISERIAYREAQNRGQAITETSVAALNKRADTLIEALLNKVADEVGRAASTHAKKQRKT